MGKIAVTVIEIILWCSGEQDGWHINHQLLDDNRVLVTAGGHMAAETGLIALRSDVSEEALSSLAVEKIRN